MGLFALAQRFRLPAIQNCIIKFLSRHAKFDDEDWIVGIETGAATKEELIGFFLAIEKYGNEAKHLNKVAVQLALRISSKALFDDVVEYIPNSSKVELIIELNKGFSNKSRQEILKKPLESLFKFPVQE